MLECRSDCRVENGLAGNSSGGRKSRAIVLAGAMGMERRGQVGDTEEAMPLVIDSLVIQSKTGDGIR